LTLPSIPIRIGVEQTFQQKERTVGMQAFWVEIPVHDLERAATFYQTVFGLSAGEIDDDGVRRTLDLVNPTDSGGIGISLNQTANFEPSDKGIFIYFRSEGDSLEKVIDAGPISPRANLSKVAGISESG
jgi:predicted enzyme related to lactoylglutathione lyase